MSILQNAVDSILLGIEDYEAAKKSHVRILSAIRNLTAGLILLFKHKLLELSPADSDEVLLKSKIQPRLDSNGQLNWIGKGSKTVDVDEIIDRLTDLGVVVEWSLLRRLRDIRNQVEHYHAKDSFNRIMEAMAASFHLIQQFVPQYLDESPAQLLGQKTWDYLLEQDAFFEAELRACQKNLLSIQWPVAALRNAIDHMECLDCGSPLVKADNPDADIESLEISCTKCGFVTDSGEFVEATLTNYFAGELHQAARFKIADPLVECPSCERGTYIPSENRCAACGYVVKYQECPGCGSPLDPFGSGDCWCRD